MALARRFWTLVQSIHPTQYLAPCLLQSRGQMGQTQLNRRKDSRCHSQASLAAQTTDRVRQRHLQNEEVHGLDCLVLTCQGSVYSTAGSVPCRPIGSFVCSPVFPRSRWTQPSGSAAVLADLLCTRGYAACRSTSIRCG